MDYRKIIEAQGIDESNLPQEVKDNIASLKKLANMKNTDNKKKQINDLIYHQIIDWLADEEERQENEANDNKTKELEARIASHKSKLEKAGMIADEQGNYSNVCGTVKVPENLIGTEATDASIEELCAKAKQDDIDASEKKTKKEQEESDKKSKQDAIEEAKNKKKEKAKNFGLFDY